MRTSRFRRSFAAGASVAVAAAGLAAFAPAAVAESADLTFSCSTTAGTHDFITKAKTTLPATVEQGTKVAGKFTATVTVPEAVRNTASAGLKAENATGTAKITASINGAPVELTATIPSTPVPSEVGAPFVVVATGDVAFEGKTLGAHVLKVDKWSAALSLTKEDGTPTLIPTASINCAPKAGVTQDMTVDTINVTAPPKADPQPEPPAAEVQTTKTKVLAAKFKKKQKKVVAKVAVANRDGSAASGDVKVVLKKGKKKLGKTVVTLNGKGKKKVVFKKIGGKKIAGKGKFQLVVKYKGSDESKKSMKKVKFRLKK